MLRETLCSGDSVRNNANFIERVLLDRWTAPEESPSVSAAREWISQRYKRLKLDHDLATAARLACVDWLENYLRSLH